MSQLEPTAAATVAGEDLACGASLSPHELVRLRIIPKTAGYPLRVIAICLPFVYAKTPSGKTVTIDARRTQLVRLHRTCAKAIWKELRSARKQHGPSKTNQ